MQQTSRIDAHVINAIDCMGTDTDSVKGRAVTIAFENIEDLKAIHYVKECFHNLEHYSFSDKWLFVRRFQGSEDHAAVVLY